MIIPNLEAKEKACTSTVLIACWQGIELSSNLILSCWQVFLKRGAHELIMPPWDWQELQGAMPIFPGVDLDRLHHLYQKWGGSVRWCLANALLDDNEAHLDAGIAATDLPALQAAVSGREFVEQVCSNISFTCMPRVRILQGI